MWVKILGFFIIFLNFNICEGARIGSVLTDESKRILDIFDFSNFDRQEALGYIERQRFENVIRGKRSKWDLGEKINCTDPKEGLEDFIQLNLSKHEKDGRPDELRLIRNIQAGKHSREKYLAEKISQPNRIQALNHIREQRQEKQRNQCLKKYYEYIIDEDDCEEIKEEERGRKRKKKRKKKRHYWGKWSEWSPCSVTCGKGRKIRSRKCIAKVCPIGEIEMGEKSCQLPACSLIDRFLNLF